MQSTTDRAEAPIGPACAMTNRTILCKCLVDSITNGMFGLAFNAASTRKRVSFQMPVRRPGGHWELARGASIGTPRAPFRNRAVRS